ncbi:hypothetical protein AB0B28_16820 [Glycomyces sp. NPDC046736]|uniref:hypothetical protein n=1 Tax=Glycomyces sp. NPDC046736 TaxID=3155615 RepID=UPI0033C8EF7C
MSNPAPVSHQTYPCADCGAQLQFAPGTTALSCPYCGAQQQIAPQQRKVVEHAYSELGEKTRRDPADAAPNLFVCTGCRAHTESDAWSDVCQFCSAPVVADQFDPDLVAPEAVVPFKLDKSGAREALKAWVASRWFAPNAFKKVSEAESLKSTYLPHWTWDADTTSTYRGERGEHYYVERDGKRERRTRWHRAHGTVRRSFDDVVVPATSHVAGDHLDDLAKDWDTSAAQAFQPQYLSGHFTQRYEVGPEQGLEAAKQKMAPVIRSDVKRDIGGDAQRIHQVDTVYGNLTYKLLLLPVWLLAYLFNGKTWQVLVSGQTGRIEGERPWSAWKITFAVLAALIVLAGVVYLLYTNQ